MNSREDNDQRPDEKEENSVTEESTESNAAENVDQESEEAVNGEEKLQSEVAEWKDKHLRLYAEFDNFKRRTSKERLELLQMASKDVIVDLLPVLDDFERAQKSMESATDIQSVLEGVRLIHQKLKNILSQKGLKEMESRNTEFDADIHEAVTNIPAPSDDLKGRVVDELEKGYYLNDKVIRFAKVVVGT